MGWAAVVGVVQSGATDSFITQFHDTRSNKPTICYNCLAATFDVYKGYAGTLGLSCLYVESDPYGNAVNELRIIEHKKRINEEHEYIRQITIGIAPYLTAGDVPKIIHCAEKYGLIFLVTKAGYLYVYEMTSGVLVYWQKVLTDPVLKII